MKTKIAWLVIGLLCLFEQQLHAGAGAIDPTFGATISSGPVYATVIQPDNRILVAGAFSSINNISRGRVARLYADGSLDLTFLSNNVAGANSTIWAMTQQTDGRIVIAGDFTTVNSQSRYHVARLNFDGSLDGSFAPSNSLGSTVYAVAVQPDGKVLVGGSFVFSLYPQINRYYLIRLNADGSLDSNFAPGLALSGPVYALAVQWDGKIIVGGSFSSVGYGLTRNNIVRLESDGTPDVTFPNASSFYGVSGAVRAIVVQPDDKILIGGDFNSVNNTTMPRLGRMNSDGSTDTTFNYQLPAGPSSTVYCLDLQNNSSILAGGAFTSYNSSSRSHIVRTFPDGTLDNSFFGTNTLGGNVRSIAVQNDGKLLVGGEFTTINNSSKQSYLARLYGDLYPPEIVTQPRSVSTNVGASVTFNVNAGNPTPVNYQWRKNGSDIPGATLNSYQLFNVQFADAGSYSAFLSDGVGGTNSTNAVLVVGIAPSITNQPSSLVVTQGQSATFTVGATGTPLPTYQWFKSGVALLGATNSSYSIASTLEHDGGQYWAVVSNFLGKATSSVVTLTVITPATITLQPSSTTVGEGSNTVLQASVDGTAVTTQWYKNNSPIGAPVTLSGPTDRSLQLTAVQLNDSGDYFFTVSNLFGQFTSEIATVTVQRYPPIINTQPASQHIPVGGSLSLFVDTSGTTLNFQWQKDGADVFGATASALLSTNVALTDAGSYTVIVSNPLNTITSAVALIDIGYPPTVTNQPPSATNIVGDTVTLSAGVDGTGPIQFLWLLNGSALNNATNATLTLTNVQLSDAGTYVLSATNVYGGTTSSNAVLLVVPSGPAVTAGLSNQSASLQISGPPSGVCLVEVATSLTPPVNWQPIMTNCLSTNGTWNFVDTNTTAQPETYYRITVLH